jgi:hypothetical protein
LVPYDKEVLLLADMPEWGTSDIQLIRIGDLQLVAILGEVFVEFGRKRPQPPIRQSSAWPTTMSGICQLRKRSAKGDTKPGVPAQPGPRREQGRRSVRRLLPGCHSSINANRCSTTDSRLLLKGS